MMQGLPAHFAAFPGPTGMSRGMSRSLGILMMSLAIVVITHGQATFGQNRSIVELQRGRVTSPVPSRHEPGGSAALINLNPNINAWYIFEYQRPDRTVETYHLENAFPENQRLELDDESGLVLIRDSVSDRCVLWRAGEESLLSVARKAERPYVELCDGRVYLRNETKGRRTRKEWVTDLLRDRVKYGEQITSFIKEKFFRDKYRQTGQRRPRDSGGEDVEEHHRPAGIHRRAEAETIILTAPELNFAIAAEPTGGVRPGRWYPIPGYPGIFLSVVTPEFVEEESSWAQQGLIDPLEDKESSALIYLVAFDLSVFDLGFALGTDHPRVDWSDRIPESSRDPRLPGPDGFGNVSPLVRTGKINPREVTSVAATFAGGFKRVHGAFKWGDMAGRNFGTHYGFIVNGVVFSTLQPGLATLIAYNDGQIDMRTWEESDEASLPYIRYARQNGVPLLEPDTISGSPRPGRFVRDWAKGNWSGSESKQLRTLRAGTCIQQAKDTRFLIYAYFSAATPSTMARVLRACDCEYAMHLDMNAPEHAYLAIYRVEGTQFIVQRLVKEMAEVDPPVDGVELPRFIGYSDNRDFFFLLRKGDGE